MKTSDSLRSPQYDAEFTEPPAFILSWVYVIALPTPTNQASKKHHRSQYGPSVAAAQVAAVIC